MMNDKGSTLLEVVIAFAIVISIMLPTTKLLLSTSDSKKAADGLINVVEAKQQFMADIRSNTSNFSTLYSFLGYSDEKEFEKFYDTDKYVFTVKVYENNDLNLRTLKAGNKIELNELAELTTDVSGEPIYDITNGEDVQVTNLNIEVISTSCHESVKSRLMKQENLVDEEENITVEDNELDEDTSKENGAFDRDTNKFYIVVGCICDKKDGRVLQQFIA